MQEYIHFAETFSKKSGAIIRENFSLGMSKEWKSDNSPVTKTDTTINSLLVEEVHRLFPTHSILAEEESSVQSNSDYVWVCDPVDGTIPFSHGMPLCTFSLALVKNGESILGVIYDPFQDRLFRAVKDGGTLLNGQNITVNKNNSLKGSVGDCEFFSTALFDISTLVVHLEMVERAKVLKLSSYIYPSTLVAAGECSFTIFPNNTVHDAAAVKIIVEEAGGRVTSLFGEEQRYDGPVRGLLVSNGVLHDQLLDLVKRFVQIKRTP